MFLNRRELLMRAGTGLGLLGLSGLLADQELRRCRGERPAGAQAAALCG